MRLFESFLLELSALMSMCLMLAILMGVPAFWALVGAVVLLDLGVIAYVKGLPREPSEPGQRIRTLSDLARLDLR